MDFKHKHLKQCQASASFTISTSLSKPAPSHRMLIRNILTIPHLREIAIIILIPRILHPIARYLRNILSIHCRDKGDHSVRTCADSRGGPDFSYAFWSFWAGDNPAGVCDPVRPGAIVFACDISLSLRQLIELAISSISHIKRKEERPYPSLLVSSSLTSPQHPSSRRKICPRTNCKQIPQTRKPRLDKLHCIIPAIAQPARHKQDFQILRRRLECVCWIERLLELRTRIVVDH